MRNQTIRVNYPHHQLGDQEMVLMTSLDDWQQPLKVLSNPEPSSFAFEVESSTPFFHFKPCLQDADGKLTWSVGSNFVSPLPADRIIFPFFHSPASGHVSEKIELKAQDGERYHFRVYTPPGYHENTERAYPVCYMHDGHNLFFPEEAFAGRTWEVKRTLELLDKMNSIEPCIVVALYPNDRMRDYAEPGAKRYARFIVGKVLPYIEASFRAIGNAESRVVMGSSLGGLISFYLAWNHSEIFGRAACLSSTFGYKNTLFQQVSEQSKPDLKLYLDSGWPGDNFAVTQAMAHLLLSKGFELGTELNYVAVPEASHDESAWGHRLHLPFQFLLGLGYGQDRVIDPIEHPLAS